MPENRETESRRNVTESAVETEPTAAKADKVDDAPTKAENAEQERSLRSGSSRGASVTDIVGADAAAKFGAAQRSYKKAAARKARSHRLRRAI